MNLSEDELVTKWRSLNEADRNKVIEFVDFLRMRIERKTSEEKTAKAKSNK